MTDATPTLFVKVHCTDLPGRRFVDPRDVAMPIKDPVYLGIQKGTEVIELVSADRKEAAFVAEFRVGKKKDGSPNFLGPFAQGPIDDRFFYLSWGVQSRPGQFSMFRRLKIRLGHLKWTQIRKSIASKTPLDVELRLTDAKGGPLCATPPASHISWR